MEVLAVFNAKGGVGKTTTAVNLAACFAALGKKVLLLDLDSQGNATSSMGLKKLPEVGSYDVITNRSAIEKAIVRTSFDNLSLLGATKNLATIDVDLALGDLENRTIRNAIQPLAPSVDIVVLDCAPTFGTVTINALVSADAVLIPTQPSPYAHDGLVRTWTILGRIRSDLSPALKIVGILPTFCQAKGDGLSGEKEILLAMTAEFGDLVREPGIANAGEYFTEASIVGLPSVIYDPNHPASLSYIHLAIELLGLQQPGSTSPDEPQFRAIGTASTEDMTIATHAVVECFEAWQQQAKENGLFEERTNLPPVDGAAMQTASDAARPLLQSTVPVEGLTVAVIAVTVGVSILTGLVGFFAGWQFGLGS